MTTNRSRVSVYAGRDRIGHVIEEDRKRFVAFDITGRQVGVFATMRLAMAAVPSPTAPTPTPR